MNELEKALGNCEKKFYEEGYNSGMADSFRYYEVCKKISNRINLAAKERSLSKKRDALKSTSVGIHFIYNFVRCNPNFDEASKMKENLEKLAKENGFVMTDQGVYLDNFP